MTASFRSKAASIVLATGFIFLISVSSLVIVQYYRPTLMEDQWFDLETTRRIISGTFGFRDVFAQANEHIIFTSRLFFLIDAAWFGYQSIFLLIVTFLFQLALGAVIGWLWFDRTSDTALRIAAALGGAATMVALAQWEILLHSFSLQFTLVFLFSLLSLLALAGACTEPSGVRSGVFFTLFAGLYVLATFSMGNGLFLIGSAGVLVFLLRASGRLVVATFCVGAIVVALFLSVYQHPSYRVLATDWRMVPDVARFAAHVLAAPFVAAPLGRSILGFTGIAVLICTTAIVIRDRKAGRRIPLGPSVLLCFAGFVLASSVAIAIGRLPCCGLGSAGLTRYMSTSLLFWLSLAGAVFWTLCNRLGFARMQRGLGVAFVATMWLLVLWLDFDPVTRNNIRLWVTRSERGSMALLNNVYLTDTLGADALANPVMVKRMGKALHDLRWSLFSPSQKAYVPPVQLLAGLSSAVRTCRGGDETVVRLDGRRLALSGRLLPPTGEKDPRWIFVRDSSDRTVGFLQSLGRPDLQDTSGRALRPGFFGGVDFKQPIPPGPLKISLVAVFDDNEPLCTLNVELNVPASETSTFSGEFPAQPIAGLRVESIGQSVTFSDQVPGLPPAAAPAAKPNAGPDTVFRFDTAALGTNDLVIPVTSRGALLPIGVEVAGGNGPVASMILTPSSVGVWRIGVIRRAQLPAGGDVTVTLRAPAGAPPSTIVVGPPFATLADDNRAAIY